MRTLTAITATAAVLAAVVSAAAPASADVLSFTDKRGDAAARYDLTALRVNNSAARVSATVHVRDLRGDRTQIFGLTVAVVGGDTTYMLSTVRRANGTTTSRIDGYTSDYTDVTSDCTLVSRWQPVKNTISVSLPRACVGGPGALRANLYIGAGNGSTGDPADQSKVVRVGQG
ncbi:hypothetical protein KRR39_20860 [Nocardioides panacis]|uniref:Secreted protein n=1 Tax=Nocardioides panacis TaxID=2849501 RepID=A0A975SXR0_9ACTN|nr:hypothetical protein [Nocardioides panacis]QWZ07811.1 hypothetical protein KRR39_20860 [Nocardioides panacis]